MDELPLADRRKSRFRQQLASLRQNMRNRHHLQNSGRNVHVSCMGKLAQSTVQERRLAAFEKMNLKSVASTKSFDTSADACLSLCRFSDGGMPRPSPRSDSRRPKNAKARNRGVWGTDSAAGADAIR